MCNDERVRRACGVIMWAIKSGQSLEHAVAKATAREPDLEPECVEYATAWAHNALLAGDAMTLAGDHVRLCDVLDNCGVPWREIEGDE